MSTKNKSDQARLDGLRGNSKQVTQADKDKVEKLLDKSTKELKKRKRIVWFPDFAFDSQLELYGFLWCVGFLYCALMYMQAMDALGAILEGYPKSKKALYVRCSQVDHVFVDLRVHVPITFVRACSYVFCFLSLCLCM